MLRCDIFQIRSTQNSDLLQLGGDAVVFDYFFDVNIPRKGESTQDAGGSQDVRRIYLKYCYTA